MKKDKNKKIKDTIFKIIHAICYVLSGFAILFIILASIFSCSSSPNVDVRNNDIVLKNNKFKNQAIENDAVLNEVIGYRINTGSWIKRPSTITNAYQTTYSASYGSTYIMTIRDSNDSVHALDETWTIIYNIHFPVRNGDYIRFETPNFTRQFDADLNDDVFYLSYEYAPENYTYEEIYFPVSLTYESTNYNKSRLDFAKYFIELPYTDYQLRSDWTPMAYMINGGKTYTFAIATGYNEQLNNLQVNNPIFGPSYKILDSTLFAVNGFLYTDLLFHVQILDFPTFMIYEQDYNNPVDYHFGSSPTYFVDFVYAYNNTTERFQTIWSVPYEDIDNTYHIYSFQAGFLNNKLSKIRLFDRNLNKAVLGQYTNFDILSINGYVVANTNSGGSTLDAINEVFELFGIAIGGIAPLLNISIGSGITLGALILIPLTATIVLFIVKLFKR